MGRSQPPAGAIRIGISGWRYEGWRGVFYPEALAQKRELEYASRQVNSIEINGSFYSLQRPENYHAWHEATPADFVFSVKASRFLTHMRRLKDADTALANFLASGILRLREKLGPILWQLTAPWVGNSARGGGRWMGYRCPQVFLRMARSIVRRLTPSSTAS